MSHVEVQRGDNPLVLGLPHTGIDVPPDCFERLNEVGRGLADTDWHIHTLYDGLVDGVTTVRTRIHRYVIDANRDPSGVSLYPGQNTTTLCPLTDFDGNLIYRDGAEPDPTEIERRRVAYHAPYHAALEAEMARVREQHGFAFLYDCHSIRSVIPYLFEGVLPNFNVGTNEGATCAEEIEATVAKLCAGANGFSSIINGRFKGGWTTRHYGRPDEGWHAIQMELAQSTYLTEEGPPWTYDTVKAERLQTHLKTILEILAAWRPK